MKRIVLSTLVASMAFASSAQANKLDGFFGGVNLSLNSAELDIKIPGVGSATVSNDGQTFGFGANAGWGMSFNQFYLGADFGYKSNGGDSKISAGGASIKSEAKNLMALSILPGFYVQPETLIFGRLGKGTLDVTLKASAPGVSDSATESADGMVLGFGVKHLFTNKISGVFEYQRLTGDKSVGGDKFDLTANSFNFGAQYNF